MYVVLGDLRRLVDDHHVDGAQVLGQRAQRGAQNAVLALVVLATPVELAQ